MRSDPIKLPLPRGKILVFDHIAGKVYVTDQTPGPWTPPVTRDHSLPTESVEAVIRPEEYRWRVGRKVGRTIYLLVSRDERKPSDADILIGMMDTPALAAEAVRAHNLDIDIRSSR